MKNKNKKKKGFTLIELIAVIAIIVILAVIIVPNVIGYQNKARISAIKASAKTTLSVINAVKVESEDPNAITNYIIATTAPKGDTSLATNPAPSAELQKAAVDKLQEIIKSEIKDYDFYKPYK